MSAAKEIGKFSSSLILMQATGLPGPGFSRAVVMPSFDLVWLLFPGGRIESRFRP
jgi:hypothetical protein